LKIFVQVKGAEDIQRRIRKAMQITTDQAESILMQAGQNVAKAVQTQAPGSIKQAVVVKQGKNNGKRLTVMVAIDRKKAPHAGLVEKGTKARFTKSGAARGVMPAHPYFRPAVDAAAPKQARWIRAQLKKAAQEAAT
jgi:HK97 gp10 family phage protein